MRSSASFLAAKLAMSFLLDTCAVERGRINVLSNANLSLRLRLIWGWHVAVVILVPLEQVEPHMVTLSNEHNLGEDGT